jgi:hypothetical protein
MVLSISFISAQALTIMPISYIVFSMPTINQFQPLPTAEQIDALNQQIAGYPLPWNVTNVIYSPSTTPHVIGNTVTARITLTAITVGSGTSNEERHVFGDYTDMELYHPLGGEWLNSDNWNVGVQEFTFSIDLKIRNSDGSRPETTPAPTPTPEPTPTPTPEPGNDDDDDKGLDLTDLIMAVEHQTSVQIALMLVNLGALIALAFLIKWRVTND